MLKNRLETGAVTALLIHLDRLLWRAIEEAEGIERLAAYEREAGFEKAQSQAAVYLSDADFTPLPSLVTSELEGLDESRDVAFLDHAGSMAPGIFRMSWLLDRLQGKTLVTTVLCYPGVERASGLTFMGLEDRVAMADYKVKVYG